MYLAFFSVRWAKFPYVIPHTLIKTSSGRNMTSKHKFYKNRSCVFFVASRFKRIVIIEPAGEVMETF